MEKRMREAGFIALLCITCFLMVSLATYNAADAGWSSTGSNTAIANGAGELGAWLADVGLYFFGVLAYLFPLIVATFALHLLLRRLDINEPELIVFRLAGAVLLVLGGTCLATMHFKFFANYAPTSAGGICGLLLANKLIPILSEVGTTIASVAAFAIGVTVATGLSWLRLAEWFGIGIIVSIKYSYIAVKSCYKVLIIMLQISRKFLIFVAANAVKLRQFRRPIIATASKAEIKAAKIPVAVDKAREKYAAKYRATAEELAAIEPIKERAATWHANVVNANSIANATTSVNSSKKRNNNDSGNSGNSGNKYAAGMTKLPSVTLLEPAKVSSIPAFSPQALENMARDVEIKLLDFGLEVKVVGVYPGPVITRLELELAPGIKASRVTSLAKDLARSLLVSSVRVVEVIPGKAVVGLEIPNQYREIVQFRDLIEAEVYQDAASPLTLALGKDIAGLPIVADLARMPHLLVAGTTGSGKSVGINAILLSMLYKATPEQVRLILIDPKMLELSVYEGIPHLLTPVVTDMKDAAHALKWCVGEMERRYQLMAAVGVRNLAGFNDKIAARQKGNDPLLDPLWDGVAAEAPRLEKLPYIVVIIDEFADMIMVVGKKVEELIARIAQKARAAGIHMILATQRPSVDVITGLIKANVPTRISFQVSSRIDSRTILDQQGAEQLLGAGDMLFLPPGVGLPTRVHGAYVSDHEVHAVVSSWKEIGPAPDYIENIGYSTSSAGFNSTGMDYDVDAEQDELYDEAVYIVTETRKASVSNLQRRLKIGYNRAARLVEQMEVAGVVSPLQSNGMREVLAREAPRD